MKIIKALFFICIIQTIFIYPNPPIKSEIKVAPIKKTLLVNCRVNDLCFTATYNKNKLFQKIIKMGEKFELYHKPQEIKKAVCSGMLTTKTTISQTELDTYAVFVFNDVTLEKYNFITVKEKEIALKLAQNNKKLLEEISEQTVYNP